MAKKTSDKAKAESVEVEEDEAPVPSSVAGIAIGPKERAVLEGDVDSRLAALLADHQRMGARPK